MATQDKAVIKAKPVSGTKNGKEWKAIAIECMYQNVLYKGLVFQPRDNGPIKAEDNIA